MRSALSRRAVIETAEELHAPVMIGTAEILLPTTGLERVAEYVIPFAKKASVPVCVHFDHGLTFECCMKALQLGFTSVMFDCSTLSAGENAEKLAELTHICHAMGITVEGELGHVGDNEGAGRLENPPLRLRRKGIKNAAFLHTCIQIKEPASAGSFTVRVLSLYSLKNQTYFGE